MLVKGWKMLDFWQQVVEFVFPDANACAKVSTVGMWHYANNSEQFKHFVKMEAVSNKFCDMVYDTWLIQSGFHLTNNLLDRGERPR